MDLSKMGSRELKMASEILEAYTDNETTCEFREFFEIDEVDIEFNPESGCVYLTNSEYQSAMINSNGELDYWFNTPYNGDEGFSYDLKREYKNGNIRNTDDMKYLKEMNIIDD